MNHQQKNKTGDQVKNDTHPPKNKPNKQEKAESNDSPEIPDRTRTSDIPSLASGENHKGNTGQRKNITESQVAFNACDICDCFHLFQRTQHPASKELVINDSQHLETKELVINDN